MGCGSSSAKTTSSISQKPLQDKNGTHKAIASDTKSIFKESSETNGLSHTAEYNKNNNHEKGKIKPEINQELVKQTKDHENDKNILLNSARIDDNKETNGNLAPMSGVAFEVKFDENTRVKGLRRPPKLQKLENVTVLTAEMLAKKQAIAEDNRQKEIQRKLAKTSKRKKMLLEAREMDKAQEKLTEIEEKMNAQEIKRAKIQADIIGKQRRREQRAKKVRARAEKIREGGDEVDLDVDPDDTYNADEEDQSWDTERSENQSDKKSQPKSSIPQLEEQEDPIDNTKQTTENTQQSVHEFFEE